MSNMRNKDHSPYRMSTSPYRRSRSNSRSRRIFSRSKSRSHSPQYRRHRRNHKYQDNMRVDSGHSMGGGCRRMRYTGDSLDMRDQLDLRQEPNHFIVGCRRMRYSGENLDGREKSPLNDDCDRDYGRRDREPSYEDDRRSRSISRDKEYRERDRDRDRDRYYGSRDRDIHRDYRRSRSSGSGSRWDYKDDRIRDRDRYRERDRDERDSDDSERSSNGGVLGASGSEIIGYKSQPPNNTIMIRGLAQHITENDIRQDIIQCGLMPKDIRLIRKKDTGASRGFAFVEFSTLGEATRWMEMKQGILMLQDQYRSIMQYSIPKELCPQSEKAPTHKASADWFCIKCGAQNFKRRELCFKCHASRMESEEGGSGSDEICSYTTKTIMLRNLDALTTAETVMNVLNNVIPDLVKKVSAVAIGKDPLTSTSRGICYLGTDATIDALGLFGALNNLSPPLSIDGKTVILSYCKYNMGDTKQVYTEPESTFATPSVPTTYNLSDVDSLAEYSANKYAKNTVEYQHYFIYYKNYFTQQINAGNSITLHQENQMDAANAAAAVAQSAIQQMQANKTFFDTTHISIPNGTDGKRYPMPDISKYTFDKNSGYYYDPQTGLYYDQNSQYYWNSVIQKYLYWDREKLTYVLAPTNYDNYGAAQMPTEDSTPGSSNKKMKLEKQDKVKVAKKIAKDMERWAKTLNQKKEIQPSKMNEMTPNTGSTLGSADIGFSVLEKKASQISNGYSESDMSNNTTAQTPLVAAYGGESESSDEEEKINDLEFLDFNTLICNLCKRMLPNADALTKHAQFSAIHKQNLEQLKSKKRKGEATLNSAGEKIVYRDRAKERRLKYGDPDEPQPSKLKEKYLKSREIEIPVAAASVSEPIGSENVGNRLLQKMGWTEGQGLGKSNQGRTTIIQTEQRVSSVGLGNKSGTYQALAGESYKDCVKKMMYARYQELSEKEN